MKYLLALGVVVLIVGGLVIARIVRERDENSTEATMRQFQRGLEALDPENDPLARNPRSRRGPR